MQLPQKPKGLSRERLPSFYYKQGRKGEQTDKNIKIERCRWSNATTSKATRINYYILNTRKQPSISLEGNVGDIPLRNHLRRVLLVVFVHLAPSNRAAEVSKVSRGAAYRSQSKKKCVAVSFEKPHAHEVSLSTNRSLMCYQIISNEYEKQLPNGHRCSTNHWKLKNCAA